MLKLKCIILMNGVLLALYAGGHWSPVLAAPADARDCYYISPAGDDNQPGTQDQPFATMRRAREAVRELRYTGRYPDKGVTVYLSGGRYELDEAVVFSPADSGRADAPVVYAAKPGENPILSGGRVLTGWQEHAGGIWKAPAAGIFRQLYVNGRRAVRARTPNGVRNFHRLIEWDKQEQTCIVPLEAVRAIKKADGAELICHSVWSQSILQISDLERKDDRAILRFHNPGRLLLFNRPYPMLLERQAFHIENDLSLLDEPGEWYLDATEHVLYYKPRPGEEMSGVKVTAPRLETLIRIEGTLNEPVEHLVFRGLTFEETNWRRPSRTGLLDMQAGMYNLFASADNVQLADRPPAGVDVAGARHIRFERNVFRNLGATGLDLRWATESCVVDGNIFRDIAGTAVRHGQFSPPDSCHHAGYHPDDQREVCSNDHIHNNLIVRAAVDYAGNCGIACGYVRGVRIEHNEISDLPYTGISLGWGWIHEINVMRDNKVNWNRIENVVNLMQDGAGVYTLSPQIDSEVAFNYISNIDKSPWADTHHVVGIYFDEGSDYIHRHHNVLVNVQDRPFMLNKPGPHIRLENDRVLEAGETVEDLSSEHRRVVEQAGLEPAYREIRQK